MDAARRILKQLGVELRPQKTRIVHVRYGFEFLGYKIKCGWRKLYLPGSKIRSQAQQDALYAYPKEKSIRRFMDQVRQRTKRTTPLRTEELIAELALHTLKELRMAAWLCLLVRLWAGSASARIRAAH